METNQRGEMDPTPDTRPQTIILVDDNQDVLTVFTIGLKTIGYQAIQCKTGAEAIQAFEKHRPKIAIIDLGLPDMSGIEVGTMIKQLDVENSTTLALFTGTDGMAIRAEATAAGFNSFLLKPLGVNNLIKWVQEIDSQSSTDSPQTEPV